MDMHQHFFYVIKWPENMNSVGLCKFIIGDIDWRGI